MNRLTLLLTLLVGSLLMAGFTQADPIVLRLSPESQVLEVGESGSVSLVIDDDLPLRTAEITLQGDPSIIADMVCSPGALFDAQTCFVWEESEELEPGVWHGFAVVIGADCDVTGPGELLRWDFTTLVEGTTQLVNLEVKLFDAAGLLLPDVSVEAPAEIIVGSLSSALPTGPQLQLGNHPNPFNPATLIHFSLPEEQPVRLNVFGIEGKLVRQLLNETRGPGRHEVIWDGLGDDGRMQASGLYFYRIEAGPYSKVRKMTLMK